MSETRAYSSAGKRTIIDYNNVVAQSGEVALVCIDKGVLSILRKLVGSRGMWRTSYATNWDSNTYNIPSIEEFNIIDELISEFLGETNTMATCDSLITVMEGLSDVLSNFNTASNCGCGSGGATGAQASEIEPGVPGNDDGDLPAGFATWDDYNSYRCDVATYIIDQLYADMNRLSTLSIVQITVSGFLAAIVTPIIGDEILALVGIGLAIAAQGLYTAMLEGIVDAISTAYDDLVCALYSAPNEGAAEAAFITAINAAIDVELTSPLSLSAKQFVAYWVSPDAYNKMYEKDTMLIDSGELPVGDCSGCIEGCNEAWTLVEGSFVSGGVGDVTFNTNTTSDATWAKENLRVRFRTDSGTPCGTINITNVTITGGSLSHTWTGPTWEIQDETATPIYQSDTTPTWPFSGASLLWIRSWNSLGSPPDNVNVRIEYTVET